MFLNSPNTHESSEPCSSVLLKTCCPLHYPTALLFCVHPEAGLEKKVIVCTWGHRKSFERRTWPSPQLNLDELNRVLVEVPHPHSRLSVISSSYINTEAVWRILYWSTWELSILSFKFIIEVVLGDCGLDCIISQIPLTFHLHVFNKFNANWKCRSFRAE